MSGSRIHGVLAGALLAVAIGSPTGAFASPPGSLSVDMSLINVNKSRLESSLFSAVKGACAYNIRHHTLVQLPHAFLDCVFAIPSRQVVQLPLRLHREAEDAVLPQELTICVRTVPGIRLLPGNNGTTPLGQTPLSDGLVEHRFRYETKWGGVKKSNDYSFCYRSPALLAVTDMEPAQTHHPFVFWMDYGEYTSVRQEMSFLVIPGIHSRQPGRFRSGIVQYGLQIPEKWTRHYAEFLKNCGFNAVSVIHRINNGNPSNSVTSSLLRDFKDVGIVRFSELNELVDAIGVGRQPIPEGDSLCVSDGSPFLCGGIRRTCPYAVWSKGSFYHDNLVAFLRRHLVMDDMGDHMMPNWEPFRFGKDYCFCLNCKREFARFAGLEAEIVEKATGEELVNEYGDLWSRYSSCSHARLVRAIQDAVDEATRGSGKHSLFLPEINVANMMPILDKGRQEMFSRYDARNYVRDLPGVCPWAPYNYYHANARFRHRAGFHLNIVRTAEFLRQHYPGTKIYFLTHGYQCTYWLTMPEAIAFETVGLFLAGMAGSFVYYIDGYDARYYAALGRCNALIADSEDFLAGAVPERRFVCRPISPVPPLYVSRSYTRFMQQLMDGCPVLYPRAFRKGKEIVAFIGNSWSGGEIYGRLNVSGLDNGLYAVVMPHVGRRIALTGLELAKTGVVVSVRPLEWLKVEIRPVRPGEMAAHDDQNELLRCLDRDMKRLRQAANETERPDQPKEDGPVDEALP